MGVRLYPVTEDKDELERLANVSEGTHGRLTKIEHALEKDIPAEFMEEADGDASYARYLWRNSDEEVGRLDNFLTFGYGRFRHPVHDCVGEELRPKQARRIFATSANIHGYALDPLGVCWG